MHISRLKIFGFNGRRSGGIAQGQQENLGA